MKEPIRTINKFSIRPRSRRNFRNTDSRGSREAPNRMRSSRKLTAVESKQGKFVFVVVCFCLHLLYTHVGCRSKTQVRQTSLEVHVLFLEHTACQCSAVNPCATERAGAVLRSIRHRKRSEPVPARFDRLNRLCTENARLGSRSTSQSKVTLFQMIYTIKLGTGPTNNINRWEPGTATKLHFFRISWIRNDTGRRWPNKIRHED